jgi:type II secretory pathway pseudopilin PulG
MNRSRGSLFVGGRAGLTLVEVLISVGIFGIAIPALLGGMLTGYGVVKKNAHHIAALNLARKKIENIMNIQYSSLSTTANAYSETNVLLDSNSALRANIPVTVSNPSGTTRKFITVTVRWTEQNRTFTVTLHTLVTRNNVT